MTTTQTNIEELRDLQAKDHERRTTRSQRDVDGLTYDAIGKRYGLTRQRVMQIVHKPL
jgi:DNA-directed RNA polymerase sigma subunit (sigma70/sigma32)